MRNEYPRPDFVRSDWQSLNGLWNFEYANHRTKIEVPFVFQSRLSGIGESIRENRLLYSREFTVPSAWNGKRILLHFGAVDYQCRVYVNKHCVGSHVGGQTPFSLDITQYLNWQKEELRVEVYDPLENELIPRGKQFWEKEPKFIWYTPSSGIWQSVWIEPTAPTCLEWVRFTPDIDKGTVEIEYSFADSYTPPCLARIQISLSGQPIFDGSVVCSSQRNSLTVDVFQKKALAGSFHFTGNYWTPENPILYDVKMQIYKDDTLTDSVNSYFGMRKIHVENGRLYLNNQPYMHKLLLDQGYWPDGLITAPSDAAYQADILKAKSMGFNGCRKHEKVEDPRFLYWADHMGFLVWEGMASFWSYTPESASVFTKEWLDVLKRDYNHPCIVVWGMLNESWGAAHIYEDAQQQAFAKSLYYMAKAQDRTRLVISNDGWEMVDSDICAIHSYRHGQKGSNEYSAFADALKHPDKFYLLTEKLPYVKGEIFQGQPVVLTECGGIAVKREQTEDVCQQDAIQQAKKEWGYSSADKEDFLGEYARIISAVYDSDLLSGFCYTQLTDVEQEKNGLLTADRAYKFNPEEIKKINDKKA